MSQPRSEDSDEFREDASKRGRSDESFEMYERTKKQRHVEDVQWPPKFDTYDEYKEELYEAMEKEPGFARFLKMKMNFTSQSVINESLGNGRIDNARYGFSAQELRDLRTRERVPEIWSYSVNDLKKMYIAHCERELNARHLRMCAIDQYMYYAEGGRQTSLLRFFGDALAQHEAEFHQRRSSY